MAREPSFPMGMPDCASMPETCRPLIVGSIRNPMQAQHLGASDLLGCDLLEIRLDGIPSLEDLDRSLWQHLRGAVPLLFTARCAEEGGVGGWPLETRLRMLEMILPDASCVDIEVAQISAMSGIIESLSGLKIPWIASHHDFHSVPERKVLDAALMEAHHAGAAVFKCAAMLREPSDLIRLADFQRAARILPVSTMGMGPLAVVSRLLCAQYGSVLNYGYLGEESTAPGQWDAASLADAIHRLPVLA